MQSSQPNLLTRSDTLFGVCEALGEDLGFNPFLLRVTLAVLLLWDPAIVIGTYFGAGIVVALSRVLFPHPWPAIADRPVEEVAAVHDENAEADRFAIAA